VKRDVWDGALSQPVFLSPKFWAKSSYIITQSPSNVTVICRSDYLACQDEFFVNNHLDVKENYKHAHEFALHLFAFSVYPKPSMPVYGSCFLPWTLANHCQGLRHTFSKKCTKFDAHSLLDLSWNCIRSNTRLQIKGRKKINISTKLNENLYTDSQDKLVLSSTVASCYNCCTDGSTGPGNYQYPLISGWNESLKIPTWLQRN
jgi:hypothetical protein